MKITEPDIYRRLFLITQKNHVKDREFPCDVDSFSAAVGAAPKKIDIGAMERLSGRQFVTALYLALFQKLPDEKIIRKAEGMDNRQILQSAVNEPAFSVRGLSVYNHSYGETKTGIRNRILSKAAVFKNSVFLRRLAKKMPKFIRDKIKGMYA